MAAPKGNSYAVGNKGGRPRLFDTPEDLMVAAECYFEWVEENPLYKYDVVKSGDNVGMELKIKLPRPYTEIGMCKYIGISFAGYSEHYKNNDMFIDVCKEISQVITDQKYVGAAVGLFNANIIARDLGLADKKDITSDGEKITSTMVVNGIEIEIG